MEYGGIWVEYGWNMVDNGGIWWKMVVEYGGIWVEYGGIWWNMLDSGG